MQRVLFGVIHVCAPEQDFVSAAGVTSRLAQPALIVKGHTFAIGAH